MAVERWISLFNDPAFHALNLSGDQELRQVPFEADGRVVGCLTGVVEGATFTSGHSAPFGGLDLARDRETPGTVAACVDHVLGELRASGIETVRIRNRPGYYAESDPLVAFTLLNRGFRVELCDLDHAIRLERLGTVQDYLGRMRSSARRALRLALAAGFSFRRAKGRAEWHDGYAILEANRRAKGRRLSLSRDYVDRLRAAFPEEVRMFLLARDGASCAAALVYRVRAARDLVVAWGHLDAVTPSPMNLLALHVVESALEAGAQSLDLGTATLPEGRPGRLEADDGLVAFKTSLLAEPEPRLVLVSTGLEAAA